MGFFDKVLDRIEEFILSWSILFMALILIGNVIARSVFNHSWTFAEEVGQFLLVINTFMGISYGAKKARHINMSAVFDLVPMKVKKVMVLIISGFTSLTMFYLTYLATIYTEKVFILGRVTPALRLPVWIIVVFVPLGFLTAGIQYARNFIKNVRTKEVYLAEKVKLDKNGGEISW